MQGSAANRFANDIVDCSEDPASTSTCLPHRQAEQRLAVVPAPRGHPARQSRPATQEPCTSLSSDPATLTLAAGVADQYYNTCHGPYEDSAPGGDGSTVPEVSDAFCFPAGGTHRRPGEELPGRDDRVRGQLRPERRSPRLSGSPYWTEWPAGTTAGGRRGRCSSMRRRTGARWTYDSAVPGRRRVLRAGDLHARQPLGLQRPAPERARQGSTHSGRFRTRPRAARGSSATRHPPEATTSAARPMPGSLGQISSTTSSAFQGPASRAELAGPASCSSRSA